MRCAQGSSVHQVGRWPAGHSATAHSVPDPPGTRRPRAHPLGRMSLATTACTYGPIPPKVLVLQDHNSTVRIRCGGAAQEPIWRSEQHSLAVLPARECDQVGWIGSSLRIGHAHDADRDRVGAVDHRVSRPPERALGRLARLAAEREGSLWSPPFATGSGRTRTGRYSFDRYSRTSTCISWPPR